MCYLVFVCCSVVVTPGRTSGFLLWWERLPGWALRSPSQRKFGLSLERAVRNQELITVNHKWTEKHTNLIVFSGCAVRETWRHGYSGYATIRKHQRRSSKHGSVDQPDLGNFPWRWRFFVPKNGHTGISWTRCPLCWVHLRFKTYYFHSVPTDVVVLTDETAPSYTNQTLLKDLIYVDKHPQPDNSDNTLPNLLEQLYGNITGLSKHKAFFELALLQNFLIRFVCSWFNCDKRSPDYTEWGCACRCLWL